MGLGARERGRDFEYMGLGAREREGLQIHGFRCEREGGTLDIAYGLRGEREGGTSNSDARFR